MGILEWSIENISYWNMDIHGEIVVSLPQSSGIYNKLYLYPRGLNGIQGNMELRFDNIKYLRSLQTVELYPMTEIVELIYKNSNKSTVTVKLTKQNHYFQGPNFNEIIADLSFQPDKLILRCLMNNQISSTTLVSKISVWDTSVTISADTLKNLPFSEKEPIFIITYIREDGKHDYLSVLASTFEDTLGKARVRLFLKPKFQANVVSIRSYVSFPQNDGIPCVDGIAYNLFRGEEVIQESGPLLVRKNASKAFVLRLKVTPAHNYQGIELSFPHQKRKVLDDPNNFALSKDLMCIYQDQDFSDFQLKCGDVSFPVHRVILSARSAVFKTLLSCDMKEAATGCMDITDLDATTLSLFLTNLYTGTVDDLQCDSALKLYYAADKYQVPILKKECADFLCANLSIENVCEVLSLADTHQDDELTSVVHNFILDNYNEVLASEEWEDMMRRDPYLVSKTLTHFAKRNRVKKSLAQ